eukprot:UN23955
MAAIIFRILSFFQKNPKLCCDLKKVFSASFKDFT